MTTLKKLEDEIKKNCPFEIVDNQDGSFNSYEGSFEVFYSPEEALRSTPPTSSLKLLTSKVVYSSFAMASTNVVLSDSSFYELSSKLIELLLAEAKNYAKNTLNCIPEDIRTKDFDETFEADSLTIDQESEGIFGVMNYMAWNNVINTTFKGRFDYFVDKKPLRGKSFIRTPYLHVPIWQFRNRDNAPEILLCGNRNAIVVSDIKLTIVNGLLVFSCLFGCHDSRNAKIFIV